MVTGAVTGAVAADCAAALPMPATAPVTTTEMGLPTSAAVGAYVGALPPTGVLPASHWYW